MKGGDADNWVPGQPTDQHRGRLDGIDYTWEISF